MRSRWISSVCLLILYILIPVLSVLMLQHVTISETLNNMDSGGFGERYVSCAVTSEEVFPYQVYNAIGDLGGSYALYGDVVCEDHTVVRYLYFNHTYAKLSMAWGRFFQAEDFKNGHPYAVIGKGLEDRLLEKDGISYIKVQGRTYRVIGMIGYDCDTVLDQYIWVNGKIPAKDVVHSYTVDFFHVKQVEDIVEQMEERLQEKGMEAYERIESERFSDQILPKMLYSRWFLLLLLCDMGASVLLTIEWLETWRQEVAVRQLVGGSLGQIGMQIAIHYGSFQLCAVGFGGLYTILTAPVYLREFCIGAVSLFLATTAVVAVCLWRLFQKSIPMEVQ